MWAQQHVHTFAKSWQPLKKLYDGHHNYHDNPLDYDAQNLSPAYGGGGRPRQIYSIYTHKIYLGTLPPPPVGVQPFAPHVTVARTPSDQLLRTVTARL
mmetsp:Transcript_17446/g.52341  ORF Transcript_17446/g.52341 Transcript_17446/m.52341 type:complete len:98 (+) Transcript_17446:594-887(+)